MPSIESDRLQFFSNVISTDEFKKEGILYGKEAGNREYHWVVIDPRKHDMTIWKKSLFSNDYLDAAKKEPCSVLTNGPFVNYVGKKQDLLNSNIPWWLKLLIYLTLRTFNLETIPTWLVILIVRILTTDGTKVIGTSPKGYIYGTGISSETTISVPNGKYFGKKVLSAYFSDYVIGSGDSPAITEVIGGLGDNVSNYQPVDPEKNTNQYIYWGLAPLDDSVLIDEGIGKPLGELKKYDSEHHRDLVPLDGVIITVYRISRPMQMATSLSNIRVKDAVRIDGSDSCVFKVGTNTIIGDGMIFYKRITFEHGYKFVKI